VAGDSDLDDGDITEQVERALAAEPAIPLLDIDVRTEGGIVFLEGRVMSLSQATLARHLALGVKGVREVVNRLQVGNEVSSPDDQGYDDATITDEINVLLPANISVRDNTTEVVGGIVFLRGLVFSAEDRQRAERLIASISSVREIRNELVVGGEDFDESLASEIAFVLQQSSRVEANRIAVASCGGDICLTGQVKTARQRDAADEAARNTPGVRQITNRLAVNPAIGWEEEGLAGISVDRAQSDRIMAALENDGRLRLENVEIRVFFRNGMTVLSGVVNSLREKKLAEAIVVKLDDLGRVANRLEIDAYPAKPDEEIYRLAWDALTEDSMIDQSHLKLAVRRGMVEVSGQAETIQQERLIVATLWWVPGVRDVVANLKILRPEPDGDGLIDDAVKAMFYKDSLIDATGIYLQTNQGVVTLTGAVENLAERSLAEDDAWVVPGVREVLNELILVGR
jgi:osmotically-inducible protein OsmY